MLGTSTLMLPLQSFLDWLMTTHASASSLTNNAWWVVTSSHLLETFMKLFSSIEWSSMILIFCIGHAISPLLTFWLLNTGIMCGLPLNNLVGGKMCNGITLAMFLPDSLTIDKEKKSCTDTWIGEKILGESSNNLSKINTTMTVNANINWIPNVLG